MNHRRSVAAVSILAAVAFAACGEADDADTTPTTIRTAASANQAELAEAEANAKLLDAWAYYYDVTHPEFEAAPARAADTNEHRAIIEAREARLAQEAEARPYMTADAYAREAELTVTVEHEQLRRGVDIKR